VSDREDRLAELLARALEVLERGEALDVDALCADDPDMTDLVAAALRRAGRFSAMHRAGSAVDPLVGGVLADRYRIEARIGSGAMGVVYRADDRELNRAVAIKMLRPEFVVGEKLDARLAREGEVLASIKHGSVVTVFDRGQAGDGRTYLVMELLDGRSGAELLQLGEDGELAASGAERMQRYRQLLGDGAVSRDSDVRQVATWIAAAAAGLHAAHEAGIVHRDVKPSNLFFERSGRVVLLDFGIVSLGSHLTFGVDDSPLGTPAFMAPEQLDPKCEPDRRTDVYGLAATLYHFLTGWPPHEGTPQQVWSAVANRDPQAADRARPGLPRDLVAVLEKGMARHPGDRYATAAELRDDLLAWLEHRPVRARRVPAWRVAARRAWRSPFVRGAAALALLVVGAAAVWAWRDHVERRDDAEGLGLFAQVPPSLLGAPLHYRATSAVTRNGEVGRRLDRMVELGWHPEVSYTLRALWRSDGGDLVGAAADMRALAAVAEAPFAALAAASYADGQLPDEQAGKVLDDALAGPANRFVIAAHALRADRLKRAAAVIGDQPPPLPCHGELQMIARLARIERDRLRRSLHDACRDVHERTRVLELRFGRTAISASLIANAHVAMQRLGDAEAALADAIRLAPDDYGLRVLAGNLAFQAMDDQDASAAYAAAFELQPASVSAAEGLLHCALRQKDFEAAERLFARVPYPAGLPGLLRRNRAEGLFHYARAMHERALERDGEGRGGRSLEFARKAKESFARAVRTRPSFAEIVCDILLDPDGDHVPDLLAAWRRDPTDIDHVESLAVVLHGSFDEQDVALLAEALRELAAALRERGR
jgi:tetratricopeptide (TPR) repeat protein